jgi:tetratricopeptide (TPR) repeat protein
VIATFRADFWHRAMEISDLIALTEGQGRIDLAAASSAELAEMIRKPAQASGLTFEEHPQTGLGLDVVLAEHAAAAPGALPLLSFTLDELYKDAKARGASVLTHTSYEALGGLEGAIASRADEIMGGLPATAQATLPRVLRALTTVSTIADRTPVARSASLESFAGGGPARILVDAFIAARLLVATGEEGATATVRLAHEALISRWQRARDQLVADRRDLETRTLVEQQFGRWSQARGTARWPLLLRNPDLANADDLAKRWGDELDMALRNFIMRSTRRARLAQSLTVAAAVLFATFAVVAALAYWQRGVAISNSKRAQHTATTLVLDIARELREITGMPAKTVSQILENAKAKYEPLTVATPDDLDLQDGYSAILIEYGNTYVTLGDLPTAQKEYLAALDIRKQLVIAAPNNAQWKQNLSVGNGKIGDVQVAQGDLTGALKSYQESLAIGRHLLVSDPSNTGWQRDLSASLNRVGDVQVAQGDLTGALQTYQESLAIAQRLAASDPSNASWQRDLSASLNRLGDVQVAQGDASGALQSYQKSLAIAQRLAASDPSNASWQRDLSASLNRLGDVQVAQGDASGALQSYQESLAIIDRLVKADPGNAGWQRDLALSHGRVGGVQAGQGAREIALKEFQNGRDIIARLKALAPDDATLPEVLAWFESQIAALKR